MYCRRRATDVLGQIRSTSPANKALALLRSLQMPRRSSTALTRTLTQILIEIHTLPGRQSIRVWAVSYEDHSSFGHGS